MVSAVHGNPMLRAHADHKSVRSVVRMDVQLYRNPGRASDFQQRPVRDLFSTLDPDGRAPVSVRLPDQCNFNGALKEPIQTSITNYVSESSKPP